MNSIFKNSRFDASKLLMHALTVFPLTSISHAPQLPFKQPEGITIFAFFANENQSSPSFAKVIKLFGQQILKKNFFNLIVV